MKFGHNQSKTVCKGVKRCTDALLSFFSILLLLLLLLPALSLANNKAALVIGNGQYKHADNLPNPENDAIAIAQKLKKLGFRVVQGINLSKSEMDRLIRKFTAQLNAETIALFYYAGHGIQKDGKNYLIPVNAAITQSYQIEYASIELSMILAAINESHPKLSIALIDACRDNPFEKRIQGKTRGVAFRGNGLAPIENVRGTILSYATEPGSTAVDGYGEHSPYTAALLEYMQVPGLSVQEMLNETGLAVMSATNGEQKPWFASSPIAKFCFGDCNPQPSTAHSSITTLSASKNLDKIAKIKQAMEMGDLNTLRKLAVLDEKQESLLQNIFGAYAKLSVTTWVPTRSIQAGPKGVDQDGVTVNIIEAMNHKGNRVIPSEKWNYLTLKLQKSTE